MLTIEIRVNGRLVASAHALNRSECAKLSDYEIHATQSKSKFYDERVVKEQIIAHDREQSPWTLVEKIARLMSECE